jgi:hypothetical protein
MGAAQSIGIISLSRAQALTLSRSKSQSCRPKKKWLLALALRIGGVRLP